MSIFDTLSERLASRARTHEDELLRAARRAAAGESINDQVVADTLVATGQSIEDFRELVDVCQRRNRWLAEFNRGASAQATMDKLTKTAERERAEFERVQQAWFARAADLDAQLAAAQSTVQRARAARDELVAARNVPGALADQIREAHDTVAATGSEVERIKRERRDAAEREKSQRNWAEQKRRLNQRTPAGGPDDHERAADRAAKRVAELTDELPAAERAAAAAEKELARLESLALKA